MNSIKTKWGIAKIKDGKYYTIISSKEGYANKKLHRLIYEEYNGAIPEGMVIHHKDGNILNNKIDNLEMMTKSDHATYHNLNREYMEETKRKMSENHADITGENNPMYGKSHRLKSKEKMSKSRNGSGYFRVSKKKHNTCKQGFIWRYRYLDEGKGKCIYSVTIDGLREKVLAKGLPWIKFEENDDKGEMMQNE